MGHIALMHVFQKTISALSTSSAKCSTIPQSHQVHYGRAPHKLSERKYIFLQLFLKNGEFPLKKFVAFQTQPQSIYYYIYTINI